MATLYGFHSSGHVQGMEVTERSVDIVVGATLRTSAVDPSVQVKAYAFLARNRTPMEIAVIWEDNSITSVIEY